MNAINILSVISCVLSLGTGIYFVSRKIFGMGAIFMMLLLTFAVIGVSVRSGFVIVIAGYIALQAVMCVLCFLHEAMMPARPSRKTSRRHKKSPNDIDDDDDDEYISVAPTMTVRQIVSEYTRDPDAAEAKYTNMPMNVTGLITRITTGRTHSHVELDEKFMCVCPQGSVKNLKPLQKVCITGTLRGKYLLDDCVMVKRPR